ncbi:LicD family protein [Laribacter hongkongensis]|uniref:LicD family protein n=1 Tax=Laribacter hongkongensis TaxID=168471 RepID=UPI001EFCCEF6|nr:LicD family protein [Laribacter hongkongensis]MCG9059709.1 LicD family protein [Laribacter hongkongensis]MCG9086680.1 LicD family protein [Laribacter hongkongensis]
MTASTILTCPYHIQDLRHASDLVAQSRFEDAVQWLGIRLEQNPQDPYIYQVLAEISSLHDLHGDACLFLEQAILCLQPWLEQADYSGNWAHIYYLAAAAFEQQGDRQRALNYFIDSLALAESDQARAGLERLKPDSTAPSGQAKNTEQLIRTAEQHCTETLKSDPENVEARTQLANIYWLKDQSDRAFEILEKLTQLPQPTNHVVFLYGITAASLGKINIAAQAINRIHERSPCVETAIELAILLWQQNRKKDARSILFPYIDTSIKAALLNLDFVMAQEHKELTLEYAEKLIEIYPDSADSWFYFAQSQYHYGSLNKAFEALICAHQLSPDNIQLLTHAGEILQKLQKLNLAELIFKRSYILNQDRQEIHLLYIQNQCSLKKFDHADRLIEIAEKKWPDSSGLMITKAQVACQQGKTETSIAAFKNALSMVFEELKSTPDIVLTDAKPKYMPVPEAGTALVALNKILTEHKVPYFIAFGTLLGIIRDGEILPFDKDMDICIPSDYSENELQAIFSAYPEFSFIKKDPKNSWTSGVLYRPTGIWVDIFRMHKHEDRYLTGFDRGQTKIRWSYPELGTCLITYKDNSIPCPNPPELFLESTYGPDWEIPDPYFDTVIAASNLTKNSKDAVLVYGYERLFKNIREKKWNKAIGYCKHLLKWEPSETLEQLEEWIKFRQPNKQTTTGKTS